MKIELMGNYKLELKNELVQLRKSMMKIQYITSGNTECKILTEQCNDHLLGSEWAIAKETLRVCNWTQDLEDAINHSNKKPLPHTTEEST